MATLASAKTRYKQALKTMPENYVSGMAGFLGVSEGTIRASAPGMAYVGKMKEGLEEKWEGRLKEAFGG